MTNDREASWIWIVAMVRERDLKPFGLFTLVAPELGADREEVGTLGKLRLMGVPRESREGPETAKDRRCTMQTQSAA